MTDVAIQHLGSEEAVGELARLNRLDLTAVLVPGQVLNLPDVNNKRVRKVYTERGYVPAANIGTEGEGIEFWGIEFDFEVS